VKFVAIVLGAVKALLFYSGKTKNKRWTIAL